MTKAYDRYITCSAHNLTQRCTERGYTASEVEGCIVKKDGSLWTIDTQHPSYPSISKRKQPINIETPTGGVGTELKKLLSLVGITASPGCSCNKRAASMDNNGIEWCKDNVGEIVSWLKEEASKRRLPFANFMGNKIVRMAIRRAEKAITKTKNNK